MNSMCLDHKCPSKKDCLRYMGKPQTWQPFSDFNRGPQEDKCEYFIKYHNKKDQRRKSFYDKFNQKFKEKIE